MAGTKASRPGFSFFVCPDSTLLLQHLDKMLRDFPPTSGQWKRVLFWGDEPPASKFWESLKQQGLFTENRAVVVRKAQEWNAQIWKNLDEALAKGSSDIWPILCLECEFEKGRFKIPAIIQKSRSYSFAEKKAWVWNNPPLAGPSLRKYAELEARKRNLKFNREGIEAFCALVRPDAASVCNELDKFSLIYGDKEIPSDLHGMAGASPEANAFECIKNLYMGNTNKVWRELAQGQASSLLFFLIALLARDFHVFWQIQIGENPRLHPADASFKQGLARRLGLSGISQAFSLLAEAEFQVKSGRLSPEQALDQLLIELSLLFSAKSLH